MSTESVEVRYEVLNAQGRMITHCKSLELAEMYQQSIPGSRILVRAINYG